MTEPESTDDRTWGELVPVTRPNGRVYRPRRAPRAVVVEPDDFHVDEQVIVLGTHDEERARALAMRLRPVDPYPHEATWMRKAIRKGDPYYMVDEVRGAPALVFEVTG